VCPSPFHRHCRHCRRRRHHHCHCHRTGWHPRLFPSMMLCRTTPADTYLLPLSSSSLSHRLVPASVPPCGYCRIAMALAMRDSSLSLLSWPRGHRCRATVVVVPSLLSSSLLRTCFAIATIIVVVAMWPGMSSRRHCDAVMVSGVGTVARWEWEQWGGHLVMPRSLRSCRPRGRCCTPSERWSLASSVWVEARRRWMSALAER